MDQVALGVVQHWLDRRATLPGLRRNAPLFCTLKGGQVATSYVRALLPRLAKKAAITKHVHAHGLRHTAAFELACEGTPLHVVQAQLGHSSLATTSRYVAHLGDPELVAAMTSRKWTP